MKKTKDQEAMEAEKLEEFKALYLSLRRVCAKSKPVSEEEPTYQEALAFAQEQGWDWAETLLKGMRLAWTEPAGALELLEGLAAPGGFQGQVYSLQGVAESQQKDHEKALVLYQKALDSPGYYSPGSALNNMGNAYAEKGEHDKAIECYQKALETPGYDTPGYALRNMGNAYLAKGEPDKAIECYQRALDSPGYDSPGSALNNMGLAYADKGEYNKAIECCQKALDSPGYETPGNALNNMGIAYRKKGEHDRAIECCQKALDSPGYETPGNALNNMGIAYRKKGEHDKAIECYQKALDSPGYGTPGDALHNMGLAYADKGDQSKAIECYQGALDTPGYDTPALTLNNLGWLYYEQGNLDLARETVLKAKEVGNDAQKERSEYILSLIKARERSITPTKSDEALAEEAPKEPYANRIFQAMQGKSTKYEEYLNRPMEVETQDELIVLRGWSSAVTLLEGGLDRHWVGGGLFLQWKGHGLIIDPGFDFLDNFHEAGLHILQVHGVAVSHDHPDHNGDLRSLDDLCYEVCKLSEFDMKRGKKFLFMVDANTKKRLPNDTAFHRGSLCVFTERESEDGVWFGGKRNKLNYEIHHFPVEHTRDVPDAQGFRINLLSDDLEKVEFSIGYTGDTKYFEELSEHLKGVDLLIAHVSQPDSQELNDEKFFKKYHLGINGVARVAKETEAKLVVVGEFWAGIADHRMDVVGAIRHRAKTNAVIPAGLGLRIRLPKMTIICTRCGCEIPYREVRIAPPAAEFGNLGYLCKECLL